jgi:DNA-binding NarL/FixJ family response regulator
MKLPNPLSERAAVSTPIRILLVEDHPATSEGLVGAIEQEPDLRVIAAVASCREALAKVQSEKPDVLILDLNLPDGLGWNLIEQLASRDQLPPTLVLSVCEEDVYARRLLRAGAKGYLMKDTPVEQIVKAIRLVNAGTLVASPNITSRLMTEALDIPAEAPAEDSGATQLSDRELQILPLLKKGMRNKEISALLGLSEKTVATYKARLLEKLGVRTTPELIQRSIDLERGTPLP